MHCCNRRRFLARAAAGAGTLAVGTDALVSRAAEPSPSAAGGAMTIARWTGDQPDPRDFKTIAEKLTERAIAELGGMGKFVRRGDVVWIKPNIAWDRTPEQAANTNPDVVATLVRLCLAAGAKVVKVGDNPCNAAQKTYETSGIAAAAKAAGAEIVFLDPSRFKEADIGGRRVKSLPMYPEILETDLVINVPVAKHHVLAQATLAMKNYMGVMENRRTFHQALPECITDLTLFMKPRLCVLDAMRVLLAHGPTGGKLEDVATKLTIAAGTDIVALDAFGAELLGRKPSDISTIPAGQQAGLGTMDYRKIAREIAVS